MLNGSIRKVKEVIAAVEDRCTLNKEVHRLIEPCKADVKPNALVIIFEDESRQAAVNIGLPFGIGNDGDRLIIGNLTAKEAEDITGELLKSGYFDVSGMKHQSQQTLVEKYKMDGGKSGAYFHFCQSFNTFTNHQTIFQPMVFPNSDAEDLDIMDDDVLRKRIYEERDFTMAELVDMDRKELERIYREMKENCDE